MAVPPSNNSCSDTTTPTAQSGNTTNSAEWQRLGAFAASSSSANLPGRREGSLLFMLQNSNVTPSFSQVSPMIGSAETIMLPPIIQYDQDRRRQFLARIITQALEIIDEDPVIDEEDGGTRPSSSLARPPTPSRQ